MGVPRPKNLIKSRRRVEDDGEEEDSAVAPGLEEDSLSDGSISDVDDDADAEASDGSDLDVPARRNPRTAIVVNGHPERPLDSRLEPKVSSTKPSLSSITNDTEVMMNGLKVSSEAEDEGISFDDLGKQPEAQLSADTDLQNPPNAPTSDSIGERRRREHEEYKKKRDADPAFVPNRGGFFMHDHRSAAPGQNGFRPFGRGRGRGRGAMNGPFLSFGYV